MSKASKEAEDQPSRFDLSDLDDKRQELMEFIGDQIKAARIRLRLSRNEVADRAGTSPTQILLIEGGRSNMTLKSLFTITSILNLKPAEVFPRLETSAESSDTGPVFEALAEQSEKAQVAIKRMDGLLTSLKSLHRLRPGS